MSDVIVGIVALAGAALIALAGVGVVRLGDIYTRMHAATKATTLGIGLIAVAGAVGVDGGTSKILLAATAIFVTAPSAAHFIGRAAYRAEHIEIRLDGVDDLATLLDEGLDGRRGETPTVLFHIALPDEWDAARAAGSYERSTRGRSLSDEGFIHCSHLHQVEATANRFYADVPTLVLLTIDPARVGSPVVEETAVDGGELFPHLYGPLPLDAVVAATAWSRGPAGFALPD